MLETHSASRITDTEEVSSTYTMYRYPYLVVVTIWKIELGLVNERMHKGLVGCLPSIVESTEALSTK